MKPEDDKSVIVAPANNNKINVIKKSFRETLKESARRICCRSSVVCKMYLPVKSASSPVNNNESSTLVGTNSTNTTTSNLTQSTATGTSNNSTQTPSDLSPVGIMNDDVLPQAHHQNPGHCIASFGAINRMRQNVQVSHI